MRTEANKRKVGVTFAEDGQAEIWLWAPHALSAELIIHESTAIAMKAEKYGYWHVSTTEVRPGTRYWFSIDGADGLPDPASLSQPDGVHQASAAIDLNRFAWTDGNWKNVPLEDMIIYELHAGTFSHDFGGIIQRLDHLVELGINAIEIMPVAQFPGGRNWGYDGVFPFSVQHSYGGAYALQELVNACHDKGIAVILDVVYNHAGPEGSYLAAFGPYFTDKYHTPWGKALNFDDSWCNGPRDFFIENALMWFRDFHMDALRLDAVHAIKDFSATHLIREMRTAVDELIAMTGKQLYLIAELDLNDPRYIDPPQANGYGAHAQWVDEFHHALRVTSGQPREGYYADFHGISDLAKSYNDAYVYDGQFSEHRKKFFGAKSSNPGQQFVVFSQNHDQTGNRMLGERTSTLVSFEMLKLMASAVLVSPFVPMLFMGEEWGEPNPFLFFISHTDSELAALVNEGRKAEFAYFNWTEEPPDPRLEETFLRSSLQWSLTTQEPHATLLRYYRFMIATRKSLPALRRPNRSGTHATADDTRKLLVLDRWSESQRLRCFMNFSATPANFDPGDVQGTKRVDSASPEWRGPAAGPERLDKLLTLQPESIIIYEIHG